MIRVFNLPTKSISMGRTVSYSKDRAQIKTECSFSIVEKYTALRLNYCQSNYISANVYWMALKIGKIACNARIIPKAR